MNTRTDTRNFAAMQAATGLADTIINIATEDHPSYVDPEDDKRMSQLVKSRERLQDSSWLDRLSPVMSAKHLIRGDLFVMDTEASVQDVFCMTVSQEKIVLASSIVNGNLIEVPSDHTVIPCVVSGIGEPSDATITIMETAFRARRGVFIVDSVQTKSFNAAWTALAEYAILKYGEDVPRKREDLEKLDCVVYPVQVAHEIPLRWVWPAITLFGVLNDEDENED